MGALRRAIQAVIHRKRSIKQAPECEHTTCYILFFWMPYLVVVGMQPKDWWIVWLCMGLRGAAGAGAGNLFIQMPPNLKLAVDEEVAVQKARHDALERNRLYNLARHTEWLPAQAAYLEHTKMRLIGGAHRYPRRLAIGNSTAPCAWDCYRRATMLESLAADIINRGIEGDFCEAGVLFGGMSIYMAAMLRARGELGTSKRRMWVADSFAGLPPASYSEGFERGAGKGLGISSSGLNAMLGKYRNSKLTGTRAVVESNFREFLMPFGATNAALALDGVRYVQGFFNESLPGPIRTEGRKLAMLRVDSDIFSSIYETLERLYPLLSVGGYVIFDDWKIPQARAAAVVYRSRNGIESPIFGSDLHHSPPFWTMDRMAFWRKGSGEGNGRISATNSNSTIDEQVAAWAMKRLKLRSGLEALKSGICFMHGTLAKAVASDVVDCYGACERQPKCSYMTWRRVEKAFRCELHTSSAMPVMEQAAIERMHGGMAAGSSSSRHAGEQCISGVVARGPSQAGFDRSKAEKRARRIASRLLGGSEAVAWAAAAMPSGF